MWKNEVFINVHDVELNKFPISKQLMNPLFLHFSAGTMTVYKQKQKIE